MKNRNFSEKNSHKFKIIKILKVLKVNKSNGVDMSSTVVDSLTNYYLENIKNILLERFCY